MHIFDQKNINSVKAPLHFGHIKITAHMTILCQKNFHSLKKSNTMLSFLYFLKKTSVLSKTWCSHVILSKFFMENPLLSCLHIFSQKNVCSVKTTHYYHGSKKSIRCPFFPIFHENARMPIYCRKNVHSLKNTMLSFPYFVKKTLILSKTRCSSVLFFDIIMKNPLLSCPYFVKKRQICQKYTILWAKKANGKK